MIRSKVQSPFGTLREVVVVEVDLEGAFVLCHFYLEAIQLDHQPQVLRGVILFQRRVLLTTILNRNILPQGCLITPLYQTTIIIIKSLHWITRVLIMDLMVTVLESILSSMFHLQTYLVWLQSSPTIETRARSSFSLLANQWGLSPFFHVLVRLTNYHVQ